MRCGNISGDKRSWDPSLAAHPTTDRCTSAARGPVTLSGARSMDGFVSGCFWWMHVAWLGREDWVDRVSARFPRSPFPRVTLRWLSHRDQSGQKGTFSQLVSVAITSTKSSVSFYRSQPTTLQQTYTDKSWRPTWLRFTAQKRTSMCAACLSPR